MVRVRILEVIEHGFSTAFTRYEPGQVAEVQADLAARWLDAGRVEILPPLPPPVVVPPEPPRALVVNANAPALEAESPATFKRTVKRSR